MRMRRPLIEKREKAMCLRVTNSEFAVFQKVADKERITMPQLMERAINAYVEKSK